MIERGRECFSGHPGKRFGLNGKGFMSKDKGQRTKDMPILSTPNFFEDYIDR
jgi:hypothetical protein